MVAPRHAPPSAQLNTPPSAPPSAQFNAPPRAPSSASPNAPPRTPSSASPNTPPRATSNASPNTPPHAARGAYIALIGAPNVGKSTLLNALYRAPIAPTTHKSGTTRQRLCVPRYVENQHEHQHERLGLFFIDTPGLSRRRELGKQQRAVVGEAHTADLVCFLVDARRRQLPLKLIEKITAHAPERMLVLNKIDLVERTQLLALAAQGAPLFDDIAMICARNGDGIDGFLQRCARRAHPKARPTKHLHADLVPARDTAELTRAATLEILHQEIPYQLEVITHHWHEHHGEWTLKQTLYVEKDSQRKIIIGRGGETIKRISQKARLLIEKAFQRKIHLYLHAQLLDKKRPHAPETLAQEAHGETPREETPRDRAQLNSSQKQRNPNSSHP